MQPQSNIPQGFCQCGCGQRLKVSPRKDRPNRFLPGHRYTNSPTQQYWHHVVKGKQIDDCWTWDGFRRKTGYGVLYIKIKTGYWTRVLAHRFSYKLHFGPIPKGISCLHRCDNPQCSNPRHLFLGTQADNMRDMRLKGRNERMHGSSHPNAIISESAVREIRALYPYRRESQTCFAARYNISRGTLCAIINNITWKHVV